MLKIQVDAQVPFGKASPIAKFLRELLAVALKLCSFETICCSMIDHLSSDTRSFEAKDPEVSRVKWFEALESKCKGHGFDL